MAADEHPDVVAKAPRHHPSRRALALLGVPIVALVVVSNLGDALMPRLVDRHPLALIAMNARNRNLALVTNSLDAPSYYLVGTARLLLADPLFFLLGRWYGNTAIEWIEQRTNTFGTSLRQLERWFAKAAFPVLFVAPNQYVCLFAGAAGVTVTAFLLVNVGGTVARLYLIRRLGDVFEDPLDGVIGFIGDYRTPLLVVSVVVFGLLMVSELRRSTTGLEELAEAAEADEPDDDEGRTEATR